MNAIQPNNSPTLGLYTFENQQFRVIGLLEKPQFVVKDICDILKISNPTMAVRSIPKEWHGDLNQIEDTTGRSQHMLTVYEPGLYHLIMRSDKPIAKRFQKWVCEDILPSIRKSGEYVLKEYKDKIEAQQKQLQQKDDELKKTLEKNKILSKYSIRTLNNHRPGACFYIVYSGDFSQLKYFKGGYTIDINKRLDALNSSTPEKFVVYKLWYTDCCESVEKLIFSVFKYFRIVHNAEFFDIACLNELCLFTDDFVSSITKQRNTPLMKQQEVKKREEMSNDMIRLKEEKKLLIEEAKEQDIVHEDTKEDIKEDINENTNEDNEEKQQEDNKDSNEDTKEDTKEDNEDTKEDNEDTKEDNEDTNEDNEEKEQEKRKCLVCGVIKPLTADFFVACFKTKWFRQCKDCFQKEMDDKSKAKMILSNLPDHKTEHKDIQTEITVNTILTKTCSMCKNVLSIDDFHKNKSKAFGIEQFCINCASKRKNPNAKRFRKKPKIIDETRAYCSKCDMVKSKDEFRKDANRKNGCQCYCKQCQNKVSHILAEKAKLKKKIELN